MSVSLVFLSGSTRKGSFNTQVMQAAAKIAADEGAQVEVIDLNDYPMPLFNQDLEAEEGAPETVIALKEKFRAADGMFISTPEYNSTTPPLLKNTIDWLSRPSNDNEAPLACFQNKSAAIVSASPGGWGGMRALDPLRLLLAHIGVNVVGNQLAVADTYDALDDNGNLVLNDQQTTALTGIIKTLIRIS